MASQFRPTYRVARIRGKSAIEQVIYDLSGTQHKEISRTERRANERKTRKARQKSKNP